MSRLMDKKTNHETKRPSDFIEALTFQKKWIGGVDEADVWRKIRRLDEIYASQTTSDTNTKETIQTKRRRVLEKKEVFTFGKRLLGLILAFWIVFGVVFGLGVVPNSDMSPKMNAGDIMLFFRLDKSPNSTDVIVIKKDGQRYIGRVIAKPGETIEITTKGKIKVNGGEYTESDIYYETKPYDNEIEYPISLKENEYFVLCDHRENSKDSRFYGVVTKDEIQGNVLTLLRRSGI